MNTASRDVGTQGRRKRPYDAQFPADPSDDLAKVL